ncbi:hypothetical protein LTR17_026831 [Elasticomyces elasticus]|nr:hypothetical protein LTR17_026831 [Elasticomyces elasticus]
MQGSQAAGEKARMWTKSDLKPIFRSTWNDHYRLTGRYYRKIDHQRMKKKEKEDAAAAAATQVLTEPESELTPEQQIPPPKESAAVRRQKKASFLKFKTDINPRFALEKIGNAVRAAEEAQAQGSQAQGSQSRDTSPTDSEKFGVTDGAEAEAMVNAAPRATKRERAATPDPKEEEEEEILTPTPSPAGSPCL